MYFRINENNLKLPTLRILPNLYIFFYFKTILFYEKKRIFSLLPALIKIG